MEWATKCVNVCVLHQCLQESTHQRGDAEQPGGSDDTSSGFQPASVLGHPMLTLWTHEQSSHGGRDGDSTGASTAWRLTSYPQRLKLGPKYAIVPQGDQLAPWWQADSTELLPLWKEQRFISNGIDSKKRLSFFLPAEPWPVTSSQG